MGLNTTYRMIIVTMGRLLRLTGSSASQWGQVITTYRMISVQFRTVHKDFLEVVQVADLPREPGAEVTEVWPDRTIEILTLTFTIL